MKPSLRSRLILSYFSLVACFCTVFLGLYFLQGDRPPPPPPPGPPPKETRPGPNPALDPPGPTVWRPSLKEDLSLAEAYERGGVEGLGQALQSHSGRWPPDAWITLWERGNAYRVQGPEAFGRPEDVARGMLGQCVHQVSELGGHSHLAPVRNAQGEVQAVIMVEWGEGNPRLRGWLLLARTVRRIVLSLLGASLVSLGLGFFLSEHISRPLRRLAEQLGGMEADQLRELPPSPPGELALVGDSFNGLVVRLKQSEAARREFMADVSHNLRTPLTAITGWLDALQEGMDVDVARISLEVEHVVRLIGRLHELARWEQGLPRLRKEPFVLLDVVLEVAQTLEDAARAAEVELVFEQVDPEREVTADRTRIRELFQIFLENAVHHAGPGSTVWLSMHEDGGRVRVEVKDDGRGLDPGRLGERRLGGMGLGLAIARKLLEAHGSELEVASEPDKGTRFRFWL